MVSQQSPRGGRDAQWEPSREFLSSIQLTPDQSDSCALSALYVTRLKLQDYA